ncbi:hypothetical protein [Sphingobium sp.]|uniref:hypothetical protein n=1 Tax=Sphingobium sp. TaxID=1912891 RepID=UPI002627C813|nr:hypothetical protein [Sphingobium sp.]
MRRLIPLLLFVSPAALPAQIAPGPQPDAPPGPVQVRTDSTPSGRYENDVARDRIRDGRKSGTLTKAQAKALRKEARMNDTLADRYGRDGLSYSEQRELDMRGRALQSLTEAERSRPAHP